MRTQKRSFCKDTEAVSEVIGEVMLTAIAVLAFSVIAVFVFSYADPQERVHADIDGWVNVDDNTIIFRHAGGESIELEKTRIIFNLNGSRQELSSDDLKSLTGSNIWKLGEIINVNTTNLWSISIDESDRISAAIVHRDSNMVIKSGNLLGSESFTGGNGSGNVNPPEPPGPSAPSDYIAYWMLNENTGTTASDSFGGYDGAITGASWTTGINGSSLNFDGNNDRVQVNQKIISDYPFTISAWVKTSDSSEQAIVNIARKNKKDRYFGVFIDDSGRAALVAKNRNSESTITGDIVNDGQWYHVTGVFNSDSERKLYVNGEHNGTDSNNVNFHNNANNVWSFGRWGDSTPSAYFAGTIDEVKLWHRALNATEVQQLYLNP